MTKQQNIDNLLNYLNANIVPNSTRNITATQLNIILTELINILISATTSYFLSCNTNVTINGGNTVVEWTPELIALYGNYPNIEIWFPNDSSNGFYKANIPVDSTGNPPTSFIVQNGGQSGQIKIT